MKFLPKVGDKLYLSQRTGDYYVDMVKRPYTVIAVSKTEVKIQRCKLIFPIFEADPNWTEEQKRYYGPMVGKRVCFYDTVAESIEADPNGEIISLKWAPKKERWQHASYSGDAYPEIAFFGSWQHQPYLN